MRLIEPAPAKLNLALHVRGRRPDGRHELETLFAFCVDGDTLGAEPAVDWSLSIDGPFAAALQAEDDNLVLRAGRALADAAGVDRAAALFLTKRLPVASGIGGGSADAAAALRLLTRLWRTDPIHASRVAPRLGADVPACLLSLTARGTATGDELAPVDVPGLSGTPVLLVNPRTPLSTAAVFARWDGIDRGPLLDWQGGRNDLETPARSLVPAIGEVIRWLETQRGCALARMSGSGATCFALFDQESDRDRAAQACPQDWWHMGSVLR